jgi:hypothetical protein
LKTYLPDGDIDLTTFGPAISDEKLANEVCAILKSEEHRKDSEFDVKDVQYIHAEVFQFTILVYVLNAYVTHTIYHILDFSLYWKC